MRVLRLNKSSTEFPLRGTVEPYDIPTMGATEANKTVIVDHGDNKLTVIFMRKSVDKKEMKRRIQETLEGPQKMPKKIVKKMILEEMLAEAPVKQTQAEIVVGSEFVYIMGSHKKIAEGIFPASMELTPSHEHLTKLWLMSGEPCENVTITEFSLGWARNFKADSKPAAQAACDEGGQVVKFKDVVSYGLINDRLIMAGEFENLEQVDAAYAQAEERNQ